MITLAEVSFGYTSDRPVLNAASLKLQPGLVLVVGPNGCGKSTLLRLVAGVDAPQQGSITVNGHDLWQDEVAARRCIAYVPEHPDITPYATIDEILDLVCGLRGEQPQAAADALAWAGLSGHGDRTVRELSKGQRRRAMVAAASIGTPSCLILDEPLDGMDQDFGDRLEEWIDARLSRQATVLLATHQIATLSHLADRALTIMDGRCVCLDRLPDGEERVTAIRNLARGIAD